MVECTRPLRRFFSDIDPTILDGVLHQVDALLGELHHGVLPVGVVGVDGAAGELDVAAVLQVLEILADVRGHNEVARHERVDDLANQQGPVVPPGQGPHDIAPDRFVLLHLQLGVFIQKGHNLPLLSEGCHKPENLIELLVEPADIVVDAVHAADEVLPQGVDQRHIALQVVELADQLLQLLLPLPGLCLDVGGVLLIRVL